MLISYFGTSKSDLLPANDRMAVWLSLKWCHSFEPVGALAKGRLRSTGWVSSFSHAVDGLFLEVEAQPG